MAGVFGDFKVDEKKAESGVEITYSANEDGTIPTFVIKRMAASNPAYTKASERITRPYRRVIEKQVISVQDARSLRVRIFVASILVGWNNVQDAENKSIQYSEEAAKQLMLALPDLFDDLEKQAIDIATFRAEVQEKEAKN